MNEMWSTTLNDLLYIFRNASIAIIPWLEKARIGWKEEEAYDDWDNIVNALYENIVCSSLFGEVSSEYDIAKYDFTLDSYANVNFILVKTRTDDGSDLAFVSFLNITTPMDMLKVAVLGSDGLVLEYRVIEYDEVEFVFVRRINGGIELVTEIDVLL